MTTWYFDVISPFAWLTLPEVEAWPEPVAYRPILFAGILKHWGQLGPAEIPPKRLHTYRLCVHEAARRGIPLRFPPRHPFNPLAALRLLAATDGDPAATRTAMETIWRDGHDPSTPEGLAHLAQALGVADPEAAMAAGRDKLRANTEAAIATGVFGVPTLAIGPDLFWGADALPLARATLADPGLLTRGEMARVATLGELQRERGP